MATRTSYTYGVLQTQGEEDALHASRMLTVEERPFQRITKSLLSKDSLIRSFPEYPASAAPVEAARSPEEEALKRQKFREDVLIEFAALESSTVRMQLILSSNDSERDRYASEKATILEAARAVKDNTVELREQLVEAQKVLELRKGYDKLAARILDDKNIKSRDESQTEIERLEKEIENLQQESTDYEGTWVTRRENFDKLVAEGQAMLNLIKGIKEDAEGVSEHPEATEDNDDDKGEASQLGTPAPGGRTPMQSLQNDDGKLDLESSLRPQNRFLDGEDATKAHSVIGSPFHTENDIEMHDPMTEAATRRADKPEDTEMVDGTDQS